MTIVPAGARGGVSGRREPYLGITLFPWDRKKIVTDSR